MQVLSRVKSALTTAEAIAQLQTVGAAGSATAVIPGETAAQRDARIEGVKAQANDLSGMIKRKKPKPEEPAATNGTSKRKAEDEVNGSEEKKVRFDSET